MPRPKRVWSRSISGESKLRTPSAVADFAEAHVIDSSDTRFKSRVAKAALVVVDAVNGEYHPQRTKVDLKWASIRSILDRGHYFVMLSLLALCIFEQPAWCFGLPTVADNIHILRMHSYVLPAYYSLTLEACLLLYFLAKSYIQLISTASAKKSKKSTFQHWLVLVTATVSSLEVGWSFFSPIRTFRLSPLLRAILLAYVVPKATENLRVMYQVFTSIGKVVILAAFYIVFFGWMGWALYKALDERLESGYPDFASFGSAVASMEVLLTTANWPDVMMPAYTESRWAILFFGLFIVMGVWFIMPVALAVVVQVHQSSETQLKQQAAANRRRGLHAAFMLLDLNRDAQLQFGTVLAVFHELNSDKHNIEFVQDGTASKLLLALGSESPSNLIQLEQFMQLCDVLQLEDEDTYGYDSPLCPGRCADCLIAVVDSSLFSRLIDLITVSSFFGLIAATSWSLLNTSLQYFRVIRIVELVILSVYTFEFILLSIAHGRYYLRKLSSKFLLVMIIVGWTLKLVLIPLDLVVHVVLQLLLLTRGFTWFVRCHYELRFTLKLFKAVLPEFVSVSSTLLLFFVAYGQLGVQLYGGLIRSDSDELAAVDFGKLNYYANSMNDFGSACVTLFEYLVVNNWFVLEEGYATVGGAVSARVYTVSWYLCAVILMLNLTVAVILDVFMTKWVEASEKEKRDEQQRRLTSFSQPDLARIFTSRNIESDLEYDSDEDYYVYTDPNQRVTVRRDSSVISNSVADRLPDFNALAKESSRSRSNSAQAILAQQGGGRSSFTVQSTQRLLARAVEAEGTA